MSKAEKRTAREAAHEERLGLAALATVAVLDRTEAPPANGIGEGQGQTEGTGQGELEGEGQGQTEGTGQGELEGQGQVNDAIAQALAALGLDASARAKLESIVAEQKTANARAQFAGVAEAIARVVAAELARAGITLEAGRAITVRANGTGLVAELSFARAASASNGTGGTNAKAVSLPAELAGKLGIAEEHKSQHALAVALGLDRKLANGKWENGRSYLSTMKSQHPELVPYL